MKKLATAFALGALFFGFLIGPSDEAWAAAAPATLSVDCTTDATLVASLADEFPAGAPYVITALIADDIVISASGATPTNDCVIANVSGNAALTITGTGTVEGGTSTAANELDVANSGAFTITPVTGGAITVNVDACALPGSGIESDPWLVGNEDAALARAALALVGTESTTAGEQSCSLAGHYLQSSIIMAVDNETDYPIADTFTGVYDGDHYSISFSGDSAARHSLFQEITGEVKRLKLAGTVRTTDGDEYQWGLLAQDIGGNALISEVEGTASFELNGPKFALGGLVGVAGGDARIQYSKFSSTIEWTDDTGDNPNRPLRFGGLVGYVEGNLEIRDSYAQVTFLVDSSKVHQDYDLRIGGLVGERDGENYGLKIVRSYAISTLTDQAEAGTEQADKIVQGGLVGFSFNADSDTIVSSFWNDSISTAYGDEGAGSSPADYTVADPALPVAVPLRTALLQTLSTYRSEEGETAGTPSGLSDLQTAASTGTLSEADYRWAIEEGNVGTFVASSYTDGANYLTRQLFTNTDTVEKSYRREGAGDLTVHGGEDPETVTGYPTLGRVWEICSGDSYPSLVWEERDCAGGGSGSRGNSNNSDATATAASGAAALGLTEAEYSAYLASGLTLEQFLAQRLAATGPSLCGLSWGALSALALLGLGAVLVWVTRRQRAHGRL